MITALIFALIQPEPVIPVPTGRAGNNGPVIGWVISPDGLQRTLGHFDDDCLRYLFLGRVEEWSIDSHSVEFSRTTILKLKNSLIPERVLQKDWYLGNSWSCGVELFGSVRRPGAKAALYWYPVEGVQISVGFDLLRRHPFGGLGLLF